MTRQAQTDRTVKERHHIRTGTIVGAAAVGLATGLLANFGRRMLTQTPVGLSGDWMKALKAEHDAALQIFDWLEATNDSQATTRTMLLSKLKHALVKHAFEEENVIYPALRRAGRTLEADDLNKEHGYMKQFLFELSEMPKGSAQFLPKLKAFRAELRGHMRQEEEELFPILHESLSPDENATLTTEMAREGMKLA